MAVQPLARSIPADACPYIAHGAFELCPGYEQAPERLLSEGVQPCRYMSPVLSRGEGRAYIRCRLRAAPRPAVPRT